MDVESANHKVDYSGRRTANYKSNIWNYDQLLHLSTSKYHEDKYYRREAETLKKATCDDILGLFEDPSRKLKLIDEIDKLALSYYFEEEIIESVDEIARMKNNIKFVDPYSAALYFKIMRQYGYHISQDAILQLLDDEEKLITRAHDESPSKYDKAMAEIFEACHLALEGESLFDIGTKIYSDKCPSHWSVGWFNAKKHITYATNYNPTLHRLAGLSFNMVQLQHQRDLEEILRWWRNLLGLSEVFTFARDRAVESFLYAVGVAYEPQHGSLKKWLTKAIILVLIIDDVYDIYGSVHELDQFTTAVERWDPMEVQHLPEAIKICFSALYDTVNDMDHEIQKEKGWKNSVLPHLRKVWADFCKALFVEAKWYHNGDTPSLGEYLDNGWTSSSGAVLSFLILFGVCEDMTKSVLAFNSNQEIIRHTSLIIRLYNDQGTSKAELERGDAPSSILCYMKDANVTEEEARDHTRNIITSSWKKINGIFINTTPHSQQQMIKYIVNTARVANFIYQNGDGFGVQDGETRQQVLSCLIEPLPLPCPN
uniref:Ocimene synthase n=1 Tax=Erythranthe cardinalis TaxID=188299 RepID=W6A360_9LAMI|nr:ocimene synthase [Erythranthe cardinalis]